MKEFFFIAITLYRMMHKLMRKVQKLSVYKHGNH